MSYNHTMSAAITFQPGTAITAVLHALKPLMQYWGWTRADVLGNNWGRFDNNVTVTLNGDCVEHVAIYTCGNVSDAYAADVKAVAKRLAPIALPGTIDLHNQDSNSDESHREIWYGEKSQVAQHKRLTAWDKAAAILQAAGVSKSGLAMMAAAGGFPSPVPQRGVQQFAAS